VVAVLLAAAVAAPPPVKGRPADYCGAVGRFQIAAEIKPSKFRLDETVTLSLTLKGEGDLSAFRVPDLMAQASFVDQFDVVGPTKRTPTADGLRLDYPIRAKSTYATLIPSIRFSIYDDRSARPGYRLLRSPEQPIEVLRGTAKDQFTESSSPPPSPTPSFGSWIPLAAAAALLAAFAACHPRWRGAGRD
jgi:hypothetical protein